MRNRRFRKAVVYVMLGIMILSVIITGLSYIL